MTPGISATPGATTPLAPGTKAITMAPDLAVAHSGLAGVWAIRTIPIDAFPDVTNIQVELVSAAPGLSPAAFDAAGAPPW